MESAVSAMQIVCHCDEQATHCEERRTASALLSPLSQTGRNRMSLTVNRRALLLPFLLVSGVSAGYLGASTFYRQHLRGASQPLPASSHSQSTLSPSFPSRTSGAQAESITPFQAQTELKLDELRQEVLRRSPTLEAMESAWRAANSRYPQVTALDDPMFSYSLAPATIGVDRLDFGQKFELSQTFPWPGKLGLRGPRRRRARHKPPVRISRSRACS